MTTLSYTAIASAVASLVVEAKSHDDQAATCRENANKQIIVLHDAKVVVGRKGKCAVATAFYDGLITGGWAKGTAANYLTTFREAVKSGKPVTDWNPNRKAKADASEGASEGANAKGTKAFADLLRPAFNHDGGKTFQVLCAEIEARYQNDDLENFYDAFVDFFKAEGDEVTE